jgi:transposase
LYAASQARLVGHGGITLVSEICGLSRVTITNGIKELSDAPVFENGRIRGIGSGRPTILSHDLTLMDDLQDLLEGFTRGDPEKLLYWSLKSTRNLASALGEMGHSISYVQVSRLLHDLGYSLQSNRKKEEGAQHPDRNNQFLFIEKTCKTALNTGQPVISVDTKKKEIIGNYKNQGLQWKEKGHSVDVKVHDFPDPSVAKAIPYGIYDIGLNRGFVNIGTDHDTPTFAVASIRGWWIHEGKKFYPNLKYLVITADCGDTNGYRPRLWKMELQKLSSFIGVPIKVRHFPPATSKWNKVEHRLFSFISSNWRGEPLRDYKTVVNLISKTYTKEGLTVKCKLDHKKYKTGIKVTDKELEILNFIPEKFHGEWNYSLSP